jgi:hypothetical protein
MTTRGELVAAAERSEIPTSRITQRGAK